MDILLLFKVLHNIARWGVLLFGVWTVLNALTGVLNKRGFSAYDNSSNLLFMIFCDIQLTLGLSLYFGNHWFDKLKAGMGPVMKSTYDRFFTIEHALLMIIAWILVHVGRTAVKKAPAEKKHKKMLAFFGVALLLILAAIPWPFRSEIAQPLFRWFN